jgi:DNA-binding transcriptional LysR family regulator
MTLHQLKVFATVAKLGNFTQAAEELHIRQPSISLLIKGLEHELEIKLFEKLGNKVRLTVAGERLLQSAEDVSAKLEGLKEEMDEIKGLKRGEIKVGGTTTAAVSFLPTAIQKFKKQCPDVAVSLKIQRSKVLEKDLLDGELDLAILGRAPHSPLLVSQPYHEEEIVVIVPPKHPLAKKHSAPFELIAREPFITNEKGTPVRDMVERAFAERGLPFRVFLEVNVQSGGRDAIKSAVASGLGISVIFKCHVITDLKAGRLKVLKVPELDLKRILYIAVHRNKQNALPVQVFIRFLKANKRR